MNFGPSSALRLRDVRDCVRHSIDPLEKSERASGNGCRCNPDKPTAIEIGRLWHMRTSSLTQFEWTRAAHYWTLVSVVISGRCTLPGADVGPTTCGLSRPKASATWTRNSPTARGDI